jgi:hypothetical protein
MNNISIVKKKLKNRYEYIQGGSNMTGTNCDLFTHKSSRSYLNHLVIKEQEQEYKKGPRRKNSVNITGTMFKITGI